MKVIRISETGRGKAVAEALKIIRGGGIAAFPTETFYGLGVKYDDMHGLEKLFRLKRRKKNMAMPLIIGDNKILRSIASSINSASGKIMESFWPGPLTLLVYAKEGVPEFLTAGTGKFAVRIPGESFALHLARALDFPLTATSANVTGMPPADTPDGVIEYFAAGIDILIDGGKTPGGMPSTIVDATGGEIKILRPGRISVEEIIKAVQGLQ